MFLSKLGEFKVNDIYLKGSVGKPAVASWVAATVAAGFLVGSLPSFAAMPAANSVIGNQATASYVDSTNATQVASSNLVQTTVQQVGALTLTADSSASGAAGSTVYVAHTLTNSGNGSDVFKIEAASTTSVTPEVTPVLYLDADGNGQPDSTTPMVATQTIAGGASLKFVVAYTIPTTAPSDWSRTAEVKVTAGTTTTQTLYTTYIASNIDTIKFTDAAAFATTMSLTTPTVSAASGHPWNTAKSSGKVGSGAVYTLTYVNNGAAAGSLYVKDVVPAGFVYEAGSAVWSSLPGTALNETGTVVQAGNGANITYKYDSTTKTIEAWISNVNQNVTGTISFNVSVASTASIGTADTQNVASYNSTACSVLPTDLATAVTNCTALTSTNVSIFTVTGTYAPKFGALDTALGTPNSVGDEVVLNASGSTAYFPQTITNNGNAEDTFNLKYNYSTFINTFPSGTTFTWLSANKTTALIDTNGDGVVDTGPIAAGKSLDVVLQVVLPDGAANVSSATYQVEPEARSVNDSTQYDLFIATLSTTPAYKFSVTPSNTGQVTSGGSVTYSHTIANSGSYSCFADGNFRVNVTGLPTG
jgi:trimeric autotransporter adhesin